MIRALQITEKGIIAPTTEEVIADLWAMMKTAFGNSLNTDMDTPQGQLVTSLAAIITDERNQLIELFNQFDPRYAAGMMQDAIGYLYFLTRKQATASTAQLTFNGLSGATIPTGTQVTDLTGNMWLTTGDTKIDSTGYATANAECTVTGPVTAQVNAITKLVKSINGVDFVTNKAAAVPGRDAESRQEFELRRQQSVAVNAKSTNAAVFGAVSNLPGVADCYVVDNPSDKAITVGETNYSLTRNSIAVSIVGGEDLAIAKAILVKSGSGCAFVGNTSVTYKDEENFPYLPPEYEVNFIRPTNIPVSFKVQFENYLLLTYEDRNEINSAILDEFKSGNGKAQIAKRLVADDFVCSILQTNTNRLLSVQISRKGGEYADYLDFGIDEFPVLSVDDIEIT